jgi:hypothetical protein
MQQSMVVEQPHSTLSGQSSSLPRFNCEEGPFSKKPSADDDDDGNNSHQSLMHNVELGPFSEPPSIYKVDKHIPRLSFLDLST